MAFGDADLGVFTADFGVPVVFGGVTANGNFNKPIATKLADEGFGGIALRKTTIELPYNAFSPMPAPEDAITVDGCNYTIADEAADVDGSFVSYPLKVAA